MRPGEGGNDLKARLTRLSKRKQKMYGQWQAQHDRASAQPEYDSGTRRQAIPSSRLKRKRTYS